METAERFLKRFRGNPEGFGTYRIESVDPAQGKQVGKGTTIAQKWGVEKWLLHLQGKTSLGVVPIFRPNNMACFGAGDVDVYGTLDHASIARQLHKAGIPAIVFRSKSGGLHVFLFTTEPVPASLMRSKLATVMAFLGHGGCEIFPKQDALSEDLKDVGNWINMPYFEGDRSMRYALDGKGNRLTCELFLDHADKLALTPGGLAKLSIRLDTSNIPEGPPCLQHLDQFGLPPGTRNLGLFNFGVFFRKAFPHEWEKRLQTYNSKLDEPLSEGELSTIIKSLNKKSYCYRCTEHPIKPHCNAPLCRTRLHGVGAGDSINLQSLRKICTEPPLWFATIEDKGVVRLTSEGLQSQSFFARACIDQLNFVPNPVSPKSWVNMLNKALESVTEVEMPKETTQHGALIAYLGDFLTQRAKANAKDELLLGKPWEFEGSVYFRLADFERYLDRMKFKITRNAVAVFLHEVKADKRVWRIKGQPANYWGVAVTAVALQTEDFDEPSKQKEKL